VRALFRFFRAPREGGDPDPYTLAGSRPAFAAKRPVDAPPTPNPLPLKGGKGLSALASTRVIARRMAPKQPRGPDTVERVTLLTVITNNPAHSPGLLRFARNDAGRGGLKAAIIRVPRVGGDPDPYAVAGSRPAVVGHAAERAVGNPLTQPSPPGERGLEPISPLPEGEGWVRALFLRASLPPRFARCVVQDRGQPAFSDVEVPAFALGIVFDLITVDLADAEIVGFRVGEIEAGHR